MENTNIVDTVVAEVKARKPRVANNIAVVWPEGDFTLQDVKSTASGSTVYQRLQADLKAGKVRVSGKKQEGVGRPIKVFTVVK